MRLLATTILAATLLPATVNCQTAADSTAIVQTSLNYIEGWYQGDGDRMASALHPELAKRIVFAPGPGQPDRFSHMTTDQLIQGTRNGGGRNTPVADRRAEVDILDIYENAAVVRVDASDWVDFLQIGRIDGEWKIINVLWAMRPEAMERMRGR